MEHDVFISYSSRNKNVADAICRAFEEQGINCWIAPRDIPSGSGYGEVIEDVIKNCRLFIVIFSNFALSSKWVGAELNVAFDEGKHIISYRIDQTHLTGIMRLILNQSQWIDSSPDAETKFNDLVEAVSKYLGIAPADTAPADRDTEPKDVETNTFQESNRRTPSLKKTVIAGLCIIAVFVMAILIFNGEQSPEKQFEKGEQYYNEGNYTKAVNCYRKAAEQGNADAQYNLGLCYASGQGVTQDYTEAVKWYRQAAEQGNTYAQNNLGACYYYGEGVPQDYTEAVKWYRQAAEQGNTYAQNNLGACYYCGEGVTQNYQEAVKWFRKAAERGYVKAQFNLGSFFSDQKNFIESVKWWRKAAEQGHNNAQFSLGVNYFYGRGVIQDYTEAVKWFRKAAEQGHADAQYNLGFCYYYGKGITQDYQEAMKWLYQAAEQGNVESQYMLGYCYGIGQGVTQDYMKAIKWWRKAAMQGNGKAQLMLKELGTSW